MSATRRYPVRGFLLFCFLLGLQSLGYVSAQSSQNSSSSATPSRNVSVALTTSTVTTTTVSQSGNVPVTITTAFPSVYNVTITPTPTSSATASSTPTPIILATTLDPAFGVLGAILIITGLPSAFWGHKNRWTSFFLIGFYTLSLVCIVLILKFGVLQAVNPPSETVRGMFVLASIIAGIAGGAITIFFWKAAKYFIGAWGGFAFGLWIQCFRDGGLIRTVGLRWILYIACAVIGFVLCTIPRIHYHILLVSTAFVGASALILGVDCYTTAGLKEFYLWNLGFRSLFPKYANNGIEFPVTQTMQIELGLIAAIALMGIAVQLRVLTVLQHKLKEIQLEQRKRDEEAEIRASERFAAIIGERSEWERDHPTLGKHGRTQSGYSNLPLMKDQEFFHSSPDPTLTPGGIDEKHGSMVSLANGGRPRYQSGVSDFLAAPTPEDELRRVAKNLQSPGALPALDLGFGIEDNVPQNFISESKGISEHKSQGSSQNLTPSKEELLAEIQTIRKSIDALKSDAGSIASVSRSRHPSLSSRRTLSQDLGSMLSPTHLRPPRQTDPRTRVQSLELSTLSNSPALGASIGRPTSAPLKDDDWDEYLHDRKLLQPPSGVTAPIPTTSVLPTEKIAMPPAVAEAFNTRRRRESALEFGEISRARTSSPSGGDSDDQPIAYLAPARPRHERKASSGPVNILPPRKQVTNVVSPTPQRPAVPRTYTFEELTDRHREKMRDMQAPLTQAEKDSAELEAAKSRWERSKAVEKQAVAKRQAEKAAQLEKKRKSGEEPEKRGRRSMTLEPGQSRQSRSLSADKLGAIPAPTTSKRLSALKVEDWQREQQQDARGPNSGSKRVSPTSKATKGAVPFPNHSRPGHGRRRSSAGIPQDPPS